MGIEDLKGAQKTNMQSGRVCIHTDP